MSIPYAEVIGDPVAHSKSPLIHNFWLAKLGIEAEYRACRVRPDELANYFKRRRGDVKWRGCNVTMPHKSAVVRVAEEADSYVGEIGVANCIARHGNVLMAENTDCKAILETVPMLEFPVCLIGNGGAALAALSVIDPIRPPHLRWLVRAPARAREALEKLPQKAEIYDFEQAPEALRGCAGVYNATPLGMTGQKPMPDVIIEALALTKPSAFVFDMVYTPLETELLRRARELGRMVHDGLAMLVGQAAASFELFFGQSAPREHDAELRALLTA